MFPFLKIFRLYTNKRGTEYTVTERPKNRGSIIVSSTISPFLSAQNEPWAHTSSYSVGAGVAFVDPKAAIPSSVEVEHEWNYASTPLYTSWREEGHFYLTLILEHRTHHFFPTLSVCLSQHVLCSQPVLNCVLAVWWQCHMTARMIGNNELERRL